MEPEDNVCLCFKVSLRKLVTHLEVEKPRCASQMSECFGAGTGCHWCVPFLTELHRRWQQGAPLEMVEGPEDYAARRVDYKLAKKAAATPAVASPAAPASPIPPANPTPI